MPRRAVQERIDEQVAIIDKAQKRNNEIALLRVKQIQKIVERSGVYDVENPDALIEQAVKKIIADSKNNATLKTQQPSESLTDKEKKRQRAHRTYRQNVARIERANRTLKRLKSEARRTDASQKWRLGFLLTLSNLESLDLEVLDKRLSEVWVKVDNPEIQKKWKRLGSQRLKEQKLEEEKTPISVKYASDKADSHRKITLGGLVKKHKLDALSPTLLLGALLELGP